MEDKPSLKGNGTLRGITEKLGYLADLCINCLWLTLQYSQVPVTMAMMPPVSSRSIPRLGTKGDFKELIDAAHGRGIRTLMDFVPNHWSNQHPSFVEAVKDQNSEYVKWYTFEQWPHQYKSFFHVTTLPQINLRHAPAREHVLEAARYWLELGVDGYRWTTASVPARTWARARPRAGGRTRRVLAALRQAAFRRRALRLARDVLRAVHLRRLRLLMRLGLGDPADTGRLWALVGPLSAAAQLRNADLRIEPEFVEPVLEFQADGRVLLVPLRFLFLAVAFALSPPAIRAWRAPGGSHA